MYKSNISIDQLYDIQKETWNKYNTELFGLSVNINTNPFFINQNLINDADNYWNNGTCLLKERFYEGNTLRGKEHMLEKTWAFDYNNISNVVGLSACFIFETVDGKKIKEETAENVIKEIDKLPSEERNEIIKSGEFNFKNKDFKIARIRVAYMPLVTSLGYIMKNSEQVLRIKAYPNEYMLRKRNGIVKQKGWEYNPETGEFKDGVNHFKDVNELNYPFLNAILGEEVNEENFTKALDLMPEYNFNSILYFNFSWFDEVKNNILHNRAFANPKNGKVYNCHALINKRNKYSKLKTKDLYTNLIIVKNKIKALETTRNVVWIPISNYVNDFVFDDAKNIFDAFKTTTSIMAGRSRLLLDNIYVEDGLLKIDYDGKTYNQYDLIFGRVPGFENESNLSCISRAPYNYLNDAKRIMFCAKLRGQAVRVKGQLEDLTHEVPARVVFADWKGFNFGDSFVISESYAKKLEREITQQFTVSKNLAKQYEVGQELTNDDLVLFAKKDRYSSWRDAKITRIFGNQIEVHARVPFGVGDKISNMHGSKGIVSIILPDDKMPILKNDLSNNMPSGPIDIIVPGVSVFRRKSVGQMFEAVTRALGIPEMPMDELEKKYHDKIQEYDSNSVFSFEGHEFSAPCGMNNFIRLDHDSHTKQSFAYIKSNWNYNLHIAEMELLNLSARGFYNILNELDIRSLNKHNNALQQIRNMQKTGNIKDEAANNRELYDYFKYLGWDLSITGVLQADKVDERWAVLQSILDNEEIDIFD